MTGVERTRERAVRFPHHASGVIVAQFRSVRQPRTHTAQGLNKRPPACASFAKGVDMKPQLFALLTAGGTKGTLVLKQLTT